MFFPTFFNLSLNLAIRISWSEPQSAPGLVIADCIELLHSDCREYNQSDFGVDHLVMSMFSVFCCFLGRGCLLWSVCSVKTLRTFALLHSVLQGQICLLLQVSLDFLLFILVPYNEKDIFFGVLVLKGLVGLHRTVQLQLLQRYWLGHRLGLPWYWIFCLGNEQRQFFVFEIASKYYISDSFVDYDGYFISSKGFLPAIVDMMAIWVNSHISVHFSLLIPKMLTITLAISCLTTSNLPWFMDLTFQVPMQHCPLQHRTLLPSPVTSTAGCCFCFNSISSFFLELFLQRSPVVCWAPTDLGGSSFSVLSFCLFILFMGFSRQEYWNGLPFPSPVDHILSELSTMTHLSWLSYMAWLIVSLN